MILRQFNEKGELVLTKYQEHYERVVDLGNALRRGKIPTTLKELKNNPDYKDILKSCEVLKESQTVFHMQGDGGQYNVKLVNKIAIKTEKLNYEKGELELIYNTKTGEIDLRPCNMPTLNFASPTEDPLGHVIKDMLIYPLVGNTPHDLKSYPVIPKTVAEQKEYDAAKKDIEDAIKIAQQED